MGDGVQIGVHKKAPLIHEKVFFSKNAGASNFFVPRTDVADPVLRQRGWHVGLEGLHPKFVDFMKIPFIAKQILGIKRQGQDQTARAQNHRATPALAPQNGHIELCTTAFIGLLFGLV